MKIIKLTKINIRSAVKQAAGILKRSGLVVVPTDTAYGLSANALTKEAVLRVLDFKGRSEDKGISIFLSQPAEIKKYAYYDDRQWQIIRSLLPGPFTVVLKSKGKTASEIEGPNGTIGLRIIKNRFINELSRQASFPFTATSANISGKGPHYSIDAFLKTLSDKKKQMLDLVVDAGRLAARPTSTVVRLIGEELKILRPGLLNPRLVKEWISQTEEETQKLAEDIFCQFWRHNLNQQAVVVVLKGDLGSGKTVFAKGVGKLFGCLLSSPSFVLMDEYRVNQPPLSNLYHLDLYRLETEEEINHLNLKELLKPGNLILIEWGDKLSLLSELKKETAVFYWLQLEVQADKRRCLKLYQL